MKLDLTIFETGKEKISYVETYQTTDDRETEMMLVCWKYFEFRKRITEAAEKNLQTCGKHVRMLEIAFSENMFTLP